ncbi:MAG: hypothetical protein HUU20_10580 [Pirellulales bacterium]|nr:hypothetical protein [Pirellulales bacterium]
MDGSRRVIGLVLLAAVALALRVATVLLLAAEHREPVTYEHGEIAENLLAGKGFTTTFLGTEGRTSQQAPFYPMLLALSYACFGSGAPGAVLAVQLLQCLAGTALVLAVVCLAWSLAPDRPLVGWLAGIGAAVYPTHVYMVTHLQVALWAALFLTVLLAVVVSPRRHDTIRGVVLAGSLAGLLLLVEPILALAIPICAVSLWLGRSPKASWRDYFQWRSAGRVAVFTMVAAIAVSPWIVRNWLIHGEFVFVKSTFGYAFWQGNNEISWGTDKVPKAAAEQLRHGHDGSLAGMDRALWEARHETLYIDDVLLKPSGYREFAGLSEPERCRLLGRRAWQFIREHPARYAALCAQRLRFFLLFDETNPKASNRLYRLATIVWLVLAAVGLLASWRRWRDLWPTYGVFALVTLFHALVIVSVRFRIPVEPLGMIWAASAMAPLAVHLLPKPQVQVLRPGERETDPFAQEHSLKGPHWKTETKRRVA